MNWKYDDKIIYNVGLKKMWKNLWNYNGKIKYRFKCIDLFLLH